MSANSFVLNKRRQGNITILRDSISLSCKLHNTIICRKIGNQILLNTDGYRTFTTKRAINRFLHLNGFNYRIIQKKFIWYVLKPLSFDLNVQYYDGMILLK